MPFGVDSGRLSRRLAARASQCDHPRAHSLGHNATAREAREPDLSASRNNRAGIVLQEHGGTGDLDVRWVLTDVPLTHNDPAEEPGQNDKGQEDRHP